MKRTFLLLALLAVVCLPTLAWAGGSHSDGGLNGCEDCHTPHGAVSGAPGLPLWSGTQTSNTFVTYPLGGTLDATDVGQPTGISKLCLGCHDGTVGSAPDMGGTTALHLDKMHPISFDYAAAAAADAEIKDSSATSAIPGSTIAELHLDGGGDVQCTSCHDPHSQSRGDYLIDTGTTQALCQSCHIK